MKIHPITVDNQEKRPSPSETVKRLKALGTPAKVGHLDTGDFRWVVEPDTGDWWTILVERKSISDFEASMTDGRLAGFFDNTGGMEPGVVRAVLLEGNQFKADDPVALDHALFTLHMMGIPNIRSENSGKTAERLVAFWKYTGKVDHLSILKPVRPWLGRNYLNPEDRLAVQMIMCMPGFGEVIARRVLKEKKTPGAVIEDILYDNGVGLLPVQRVGTGMIKNALEFLRTKVSI